MKHDSDSLLSADKNLDDTPDIDSGGNSCKMMWFAALHNSECNNFGSYQSFYYIPLKSALANASDLLQPVLVWGRLGIMDNENSTEHQKFGSWAESQGVRVIYSPRLSFQDDVVLKHDLTASIASRAISKNRHTNVYQ